MCFHCIFNALTWKSGFIICEDGRLTILQKISLHSSLPVKLWWPWTVNVNTVNVVRGKKLKKKFKCTLNQQTGIWKFENTLQEDSLWELPSFTYPVKLLLIEGMIPPHESRKYDFINRHSQSTQKIGYLPPENISKRSQQEQWVPYRLTIQKENSQNV